MHFSRARSVLLLICSAYAQNTVLGKDRAPTVWTVQRDRFPWWHAATVRKLPISGPIALMKGITNLAISFICSVISSQHYWVLVTTYIKSRGEDAGVSVWGNWALLTLTLTALCCESSIADFWVASLSYHKTPGALPDKKTENVSREPRGPLHEKKIILRCESGVKWRAQTRAGLRSVLGWQSLPWRNSWDNQEVKEGFLDDDALETGSTGLGLGGD